jgi:hypothetical protein
VAGSFLSSSLGLGAEVPTQRIPTADNQTPHASVRDLVAIKLVAARALSNPYEFGDRCRTDQKVLRERLFELFVDGHGTVSILALQQSTPPAPVSAPGLCFCWLETLITADDFYRQTRSTAANRV